MTSSRKKPGVAFWATVVVVVVLLYPLSFRPVCWMAEMEIVPVNSVAHMYSPVIKLVESLPDRSRLRWLAHRCASWYGGKDVHGSEMCHVLEARLHYEERTGIRHP